MAKLKLNKFFCSGMVFGPELKQFGERLKFQFRLAIDDSYKPKNSAEWINKTVWYDVVCWDKHAERYQDIREREQVLIEGKIKMDEWTTEDGKKRYKHYIQPDKITVLEPGQPIAKKMTVEVVDGQVQDESQVPF